jgi:membrane-associated protease RseP (regulator of RpoE activity)
LHETGRMTHIEESGSGIKMTVTGQIDGKEVTREFKAPSAEKLQKQNPQAYALYARYMGGGMNGIGAIRIQNGGGIGIANLNVRMNVNAGGGGVNIGPVPAPNGLLGVTVGEAADGVLVVHILPESRASRMGVKENDVIQKLNGKEIHSADELRKAMAENPKDLAVEVLREGKSVKLTEERKADAVEPKKE